MHETTEDTEITLGTGKMLALFFGLVILCATFFGMGYSVGRNATKPAAELQAEPAILMGSRTPQPANPSPIAHTQAAATPADQRHSSSDANPATANPAPSGQSTSRGDAGASPEAKPGAGYFVQVAAVTKQEDAEALVESLKGRQYQAFIADSLPDQLFHVQLGPFADLKDAEATRKRLVSDGYNPILKK